MLDELEEQGYCYVKNFLNIEVCELLINEFFQAEKNIFCKSPMNLNDSEDLSNTVYHSQRSPLSYCYLATDMALDISMKGIRKLEQLTGMAWSGNINKHCLPIFKYGLDGYIERHRGRNIGFGKNDYVAVLMITKPDINFSQGRFFLNRDASASDCGKIIEYENEDRRIYFNIQQGDVLIFDNRIHVHGTELTLKGSNNKVLRMTTSWRMEV